MLTLALSSFFRLPVLHQGGKVHRRRLGAFKKKGKPRIFTFFKSALINIDSLPEEDLSSLRALQRKLCDLGHFYTHYDNVADLKLKFRDQLDKVIEQTRTS
jgi:hypothetical protein